MIDLNNLDGNKEQLSKESLLKHISSYDIFRYYIEDPFQINRIFNSPLRVDKRPSFSIFYSKKYNDLFYKDFTGESGDSIMFVSKLYGINYYQALSKIATDFNLLDRFFSIANVKKSLKKPKIYENIDVSKSNTYVDIKSRSWRNYDIKWWGRFGINLSILKFYKVVPVEYIFLGDSIFKADRLAYAYREFKDGVFSYKIYQPLSKDAKWFTNHDYSVWQGWSQLPETSEKLIITSSLKDVMSIVSTTKIPSVALQAETTKPKESVINELKSRFEIIYVFYDNDFNKNQNWGQIAASKLVEKFNLKNLIIPTEYQSKDYSDLVFNRNAETAINFINSNI